MPPRLRLAVVWTVLASATFAQDESICFLPTTVPTIAPFQNLGCALPGLPGPPRLVAFGQVAPRERALLRLTQAAPLSPALLGISRNAALQSAFGGTFLPAAPSLSILPYTTSSSGQVDVPVLWPPTLPPGFSTVAQYAVVDPSAAEGWAFSNAINMRR